MEVFAWELEDAGKLDTETICHIADAVTDGVQDAALSEDTFTLSFQPGSLAELEPCSLLEDTEAAKVLGGETSAQEQLGGHGCTWEVSSGESTGATAELTFDVALTADLSGFSGEIAGRPTQMSVDGYMCQVATPPSRSPRRTPTNGRWSPCWPWPRGRTLARPSRNSPRWCGRSFPNSPAEYPEPRHPQASLLAGAVLSWVSTGDSLGSPPGTVRGRYVPGPPLMTRSPIVDVGALRRVCHRSRSA